jgi:glycosyltransferase involved in cell wall biosynthesis
MLGFCDEVVVVDGMSDDGTFERLQSLCSSEPKLRVIQNKFDVDEPRMDGLQKQFARAQCTGDFLWQQDADEVVHEDDYGKIWKLIDEFPPSVDVIHLPVIELWNGVENVRCDRHTWKWRLSRNNPFIIHGINKHASLQKDGKVYAKKGMSDGCEYIDIQTGEYVPHRGHYTSETEYARRVDPELYSKICNRDFKEYPAIFHYSLANIPRKIRNYRDFWGGMWSRLYGEEKPEQLYFKDKDIASITDADVIEEAKKVIAQGDPELAFYKHSVDVHGPQFNGKVPLFKLERSQPAIMADWIGRCLEDIEKCK